MRIAQNSGLITKAGSLVYGPNSRRIPPGWDNEPLDIDELYGTAKACLA